MIYTECRIAMEHQARDWYPHRNSAFFTLALRLPGSDGCLQLTQHLSQPGQLLAVARPVTGALRFDGALVRLDRLSCEIRSRAPVAGCGSCRRGRAGRG